MNQPLDAQALTQLQQDLILHFGEMGSRWGINRTVGQIYALLVFSPTPLNAEDITEALGFSRSNVSMGIKELLAWDLVQLRHLPGDRKDYFTVPADVWDIAKNLVLQRRKRELEPTLTVLRDALLRNADGDALSGQPDQHVTQRIQEMHDFMELIMTWTDDMQGLSRNDLDRLLKLGAGVSKVLEFARRGNTHS